MYLHAMNEPVSLSGVNKSNDSSRLLYKTWLYMLVDDGPSSSRSMGRYAMLLNSMLPHEGSDN